MSRLVLGDEDRIRVRLIIIGNAGAGKSSLVRKYIHDDFHVDLRRPSVANMELKTISRRGRTVDVEIWDTAGQERFDSMTANYYRGGDGCLIVYDILKQPTFEAVQKWNKKRLEYRNSDDVIPAILVATKCDLRTPSSPGISSELGRKLARELDIPYSEVSCTSTESVNTLFDKIVDLVLDSRHRNDWSSGSHIEVGRAGGRQTGERHSQGGGSLDDDSSSRKGRCC